MGGVNTCICIRLKWLNLNVSGIEAERQIKYRKLFTNSPYWPKALWMKQTNLDKERTNISHKNEAPLFTFQMVAYLKN